MIVEQMNPVVEQAVSTKIRIMTKYDISTSELDSIYDLVLARPTYNAFVLNGLSDVDKEELIEAIYTIFMELNEIEAIGA